ncbi:MAG: 50S ribosomal protein L22 [Myxococcales bacterium]|nr:50S ribosomal protein L22 [Myxococcales bacterium]MCB9519916.1 50S ribosomal protein L22 [Myxococcales bacterium]MCB9533177.1 50S ribosomal protein L22 [Myxococcales bacterium]
MNHTNEFGNRANVVHLNGVRISPRKLRVLVDQIRGQGVHEALARLGLADRRAAGALIKLIESGVANVRECVRDWDIDELMISRAFVDAGPTLRRFRPRAQGRATRINKRTSRVTIELRPFDFDNE